MQHTVNRRDFIGYGLMRPELHWPNGGRVAVNFVLNLEEGAELSLADGDPANEPGHEVQSKVTLYTDLCRESHFEFGTRVGLWRILHEFEQHKINLTLNVCGRFAQRCPTLLAAATSKGHDICGHGWLWQSPAGLSAEEEYQLMCQTCLAIEDACGQRVLGWHCKSTATPVTAEFASRLGLLYHSDTYNDELPFWQQTVNGPMLALPYQFDTNDMRFFGEAPAFVRANDFSGYVIDSLDRLRLEAKNHQQSSMLTIGLHARIIGRPGRIGALTDILTYLGSDPIFWVSTRSNLANHWISRFPAPSG